MNSIVITPRIINFIMNQTPITLQSKKDAIQQYLKKYTYDGTKILPSMNESCANEIYDLFQNNVIPQKVTRLYGWYATYYAVNNQHDKMFEHYVLAIECNYSDDGAITQLYESMKKYSFNPDYLDRVLKALKHKSNKNYKLFRKIKKAKKAKAIATQANKISQTIDQHIQNNEMNKVYDMYAECKDDTEKTQYLSKTMIIKGFKPTKNMINDLLTLDFTNASPEIHLIKSVFAGMNRNEIPI